MRRLAVVVGLLAFAACGPKEETPVDTSATAAPPAPTLTFADVAGTWTARAMPMTSDSVIVTYEINGSADPAGWTITLPNRPPIPARVSIDGDSLITDAGPYESVLRKGVQVSTHSVTRLVNGELVGTTIAHYQTKTADSVVTLRTVATKKQ